MGSRSTKGRPAGKSLGNWKLLNDRIVKCERCPRLREYCRQIAREKRKSFASWTYWGQPVPNFGDAKAKVLIIGLAPAAHGGNRTGRVFTGDRSGDWLFRALNKAGFANQPTSVAVDDGLKLIDCAVTAAAHCAPPDNKPTPQELSNCQEWLDITIDLLEPKVMIALGQLAFRAAIDQAIRRGWFSGKLPKFGHGEEVELAGERRMIASYHPSQQNTFTGKLTEKMFDRIFQRAREILDPTG